MEAALLTLTLVLLSGLQATAQTTTPGQPKALDPHSSQLRLIKQTAPIYPAIARAAHVSGLVQVDVLIGPDGRIEKVTPRSGPAMLTGAAMECVREWVYQPIVEGDHPITASTTITLSFNANAPVHRPDEKIANEFAPLLNECRNSIWTKAEPEKQVAACTKAAQVAEKFSPGERFFERRSAFVYSSNALLSDQQTQAALEYANKGVAVVEEGHEDGAGACSAYAVRAQAEAVLGQLTQAADDLTKAEVFERAAILEAGPSAPAVNQQYKPLLKGLLKLHSQVLSKLGKTTEAEAKNKEAATV